MKSVYVRPFLAVPLHEETFAILTVGLNQRAAELIRRFSASRRLMCDHVRNGREALGYLRMTNDRPPAIILCADVLLDGSWRRLLDSVESSLIVVSRLADESLWAEALHLGACDLLSNPFTSTELEWAVDSARLAWARDHALSCRSSVALAAIS